MIYGYQYESFLLITYQGVGRSQCSSMCLTHSSHPSHFRKFAIARAKAAADCKQCGVKKWESRINVNHVTITFIVRVLDYTLHFFDHISLCFDTSFN